MTATLQCLLLSVCRYFWGVLVTRNIYCTLRRLLLLRNLSAERIIVIPFISITVQEEKITPFQKIIVN